MQSAIDYNLFQREFIRAEIKHLVATDLSKASIIDLDIAMALNMDLDDNLSEISDNENEKFDLRMHRKKILYVANSRFTPEELRKAETLLRYIDYYYS